MVTGVSVKHTGRAGCHGGAPAHAGPGIAISAGVEPSFELCLPDGRIGGAVVRDLGQVSTSPRVTIAGGGAPPFGGTG